MKIPFELTQTVNRLNFNKRVNINDIILNP